MKRDKLLYVLLKCKISVTMIKYKSQINIKRMIIISINFMKRTLQNLEFYNEKLKKT